MFRGYGIFESGDMFALISGEALFFKVDDSNPVVYEENASKKYGSMPYVRVPNHIFEDISEFEQWARAAIAVAPSSARKKGRSREKLT